uniref:Uncharacterized protein n=1 Tax=Anopheles maculatus TaxID=74869 RepID=A0A182SKM8_9DIPT
MLQTLQIGLGGFRWCTCRTLSEQASRTSSRNRLLRRRQWFTSPAVSSSLSSSSGSGSGSSSSSAPALPPTSHDRPSVDLLLRSDFRSLSTNRVWNLFKLLWLPAAAAGTEGPVAPFGGLLPELAFDGLEAISELCEVRDELRENCDREARCDMYIGWLRWAGELDMKPSLPGEVDRLGQSDRELSDTLRDRQLLWFEHSDIRRWRPL